jgi:hypothetical protein
MMDPMSTVEKIVKLALLINKAMDTVQQNKKAWRTVDTVSSIASQLKKNTAAMKDPQRAGPSGEGAPARPKARQGVPRQAHPPAGRLLGAPERLRRVKQGDLGQCQRVEPGAQQPGSRPAGCRRSFSSLAAGTLPDYFYLPTSITNSNLLQ